MQFSDITSYYLREYPENTSLDFQILHLYHLAILSYSLSTQSETIKVHTAMVLYVYVRPTVLEPFSTAFRKPGTTCLFCHRKASQRGPQTAVFFCIL